MSSAGNPYVNLAPANPTGLPYELQLAQIQRQQRMADLLRQQADEPIQVQQGGGAPAPISWGSVLGKVLQNVGASMKENRANEQLKQAGQQDSDAAQALIRAMTQPTNQVSTPPIAPTATQINPTAPQLPGGPAPAPQAPVPMQVGGAQGSTQATPTPPNMQDQLAAVLAARGGPQTQMIQNAMLPQIMGRQNLDYQNTLNRQNKEWENTLPMSTATQQQIAAQGTQQQANAAAANALPMTAAEAAQNKLGYAQLNKPVVVPYGSTMARPNGQVVFSSTPDAAAVQTGIDYFKKFGTFPPTARQPALQAAIMAGIHNQRISMDDAANSRAGVHGQIAAAGSMARTQAQTAVNEGTVNNSINIVRNLLPVAGSQGQFTDINELTQNLARRTGDHNAVLLKNGIDSISNEYARVMTGTTSGSPSSDAARREAGNRILYGYNSGTIEDVFAQMQQEMAGRSGAQASVLGDVTGNTYHGASVPGQAAPPPAATGKVPPPPPGFVVHP